MPVGLLNEKEVSCAISPSILVLFFRGGEFENGREGVGDGEGGATRRGKDLRRKMILLTLLSNSNAISDTTRICLASR